MFENAYEQVVCKNIDELIYVNNVASHWDEPIFNCA